MRTTLAKTLGLLVAMAIGLAATPASAGRIVVLAVEGDESGEFEEVLADAVDDEHSVVASQAFERAARREGVADQGSASGIAKVVRSLEADAVLDPVLARDDDAYLLTIKIRGRNGKVQKKMSVSLDAPRLGPKGKKKVARQLLSVIDQVIGTGGKSSAKDDEADDPPATRAKDKGKDKGKGRAKPADDEADADDEAAAPKGKRRVAARDRDRDRDREPADRDAGRSAGDEDDDDDNPLGDDDAEGTGADDGARDDDDRDDAEDDRPRDRGGRGREVRRAGLLLEVGSTAITRRLTFSSRANFDQAPNGYQGSPVPAAHVVVEAYPVAIALPHSAAGGIGLFFEYDRVFSLTTRTTEAMDVPLPTKQQKWTVGGKLRYAFGSKPSYPSVILGMGYGRRSFIVDRTALPAGAVLDLPDVDYTLYEPSFTLRVPFGTERLALAAVGKALLFKSAGAIQTAQEYGAAKITGAEAEAILDIGITRMVLLRLRGSFAQIGYDFTGNGAQTNSRDGDPDSQDVGGALDRWIGGSASLTVAY